MLSLPHYLKILFYIFLTGSSVINANVYATDNSPVNEKIWKSIGKKAQINTQILSKFTATTMKARLIELDEITLKSLLNKSIVSSSLTIAARNTFQSDNQTVSLPLPDGSEVTVEVFPSSVMPNSLREKFPEIQIWDVKGVSDKISGTVGFTSKGFHGMLMMPDGDRVFIEQDIENMNSSNSNKVPLSTQSRYLSFSQKQNKQNFQTEFSCGVHDDDTHLNLAAKGKLLARPASDLITYRLAVATTGEYSQFQGGTVSDTLSAIAKTISRVNEIYKRDLGIQFQLVDEQSDLIYLNPNTDPYTNSDIFSLIQENDKNLSSDGVLSKSKYDIGHVFGQGSVGGLAVVGGVCNDDEKAFGATGTFNPSPIDDAFALDYVAHELGHQVGGTHTFNSACNGGSERTGITAVEPGSGTTIMAYPGICSPNNIQNNTDPQFHLVSIDQIRAVTRSGGGSFCGVNSTVNNQNPTVDAGDDVVVPARTPLVFVADGADADNDPLTYSWEQTDTGRVSNLNVDTGDNALFRSRPITQDNIRFIPRLSDLFSGIRADGELLPITNRNINMGVTVRDGKGGLQADLIKLQVFDTGSTFALTSHTVDKTFGLQDTTEIRWNVAGTNASPISCSNVDIGLVTLDGKGLDITTTPNDGSHLITLPSIATAISNARFIVSCSTSDFYNISKGNITILDQFGGGSGGETESSGGGSFNLFTFFYCLLLMVFRKIQSLLARVVSFFSYRYTLMLLTLPLVLGVQACSNPTADDQNGSKNRSNKENVMPKEFGDRFSSEKIKQERESFYAQKRLELKKISPEAKAKQALRSNDIYLMSLPAGRGSSESIPGLLESQASMVNCKKVLMEGTGDVLYGKNHILYRQDLLQYMRKFNLLMSPYCK